MATDIEETLYEHLVEEPATGDLDDKTAEAQPRNFLLHAASLSATKTGDGLIDPKLVLAWLVGALGAPGWMVGLLVPVRESLALLPQLFTADPIRRMERRKWAWIAGSVGQAAAVAGMATTAFFLEGATAGWAIVILLALFALARSICSVSYKDVLGKTVAKKTRGTATGLAGSIAAAITLAFGAALATGLIEKSTTSIGFVLMLAAILWGLGAFLFSLLQEPARAAQGEGNVFENYREHLGDRQLQLFITARGLLTATALAPPFIISLAGFEDTGSALGSLGLFVISSALAGIVSSYVWGRLSDRSSRRVLIYSGAAASIALAVIVAGASLSDALVATIWFLPAIHFGLMVAYQGVRRGRSTHLTDMANEDNRAIYTALSNTIIGIILVVGGVFSLIAAATGPIFVLAVLATMSLAAVPVSMRLEEVQN